MDPPIAKLIDPAKKLEKLADWLTDWPTDQPTDQDAHVAARHVRGGRAPSLRAAGEWDA